LPFRFRGKSLFRLSRWCGVGRRRPSRSNSCHATCSHKIFLLLLLKRDEHMTKPPQFFLASAKFNCARDLPMERHGRDGEMISAQALVRNREYRFLRDRKLCQEFDDLVGRVTPKSRPTFGKSTWTVPPRAEYPERLPGGWPIQSKERFSKASIALILFAGSTTRTGAFASFSVRQKGVCSPLAVRAR